MRIIRDDIDAGLFVVAGVNCLLIAGRVISARDAFAVTIGYGVCAVVATIRDHFRRNH